MLMSIRILYLGITIIVLLPAVGYGYEYEYEYYLNIEFTIHIWQIWTRTSKESGKWDPSSILMSIPQR